MRLSGARSLFTSARMAASNTSADKSKLICSNPQGQAPQFTLSTLPLSALTSSPIPQFNTWFTQAQSSSAVSSPEACTLSTAQLPSGRVSARIVYLKELDPRGFVVYSNFGSSRKAADLESNPHASLVFFWAPLQRQVRVEGKTERVTKEESQAYFDTRVRGSRIGAWASRQSAVLQPRKGANGPDGEADDGRAQLEDWVAETEKEFEGRDDIPVPDFWGGLRIIPTRVEFWQGRESRLHDRFAYEWEEGEVDSEGRWRLERLSP